jgi:DNA-binding NarL/FixJ family response regulator
MQILRVTAGTLYPLDRLCMLEAVGVSLLEQGSFADAIGAMSEVPTLLESSLEKNEGHHSLIVLAECHLLSGNVREANRLLTQARGYLAYNSVWKASGDRLEAQVNLAMRRPIEALRILSPWLCTPSEIAFEQARIHQVAAEAHLLLSDRGLALESAEKAHEIFRELGARVRAQQVHQWLTAHAPRKAGRPRSRRTDNLTERELEILHLVADGRTNSEIASLLFISVGTVKKHIENVMNKAGIRRRTQLAGYALTLSSGNEKPAVG